MITISPQPFKPMATDNLLFLWSFFYSGNFSKIIPNVTFFSGLSFYHLLCFEGSFKYGMYLYFLCYSTVWTEELCLPIHKGNRHWVVSIGWLLCWANGNSTFTWWGTTRKSSKAAASFYIPDSNRGGFQCLHILASTCHCLSYKSCGNTQALR